MIRIKLRSAYGRRPHYPLLRSQTSAYTRTKTMLHRDQVALELSTAKSMIYQQFPQYRNHQVTFLQSSGTVNAIFRIGSVATARFPLQYRDPAELTDTLRREAEAMTEFARHCPYPAPVPLGLGLPSESFALPWSVQSWLEGDGASPKGLADSEVFALDVAHLIMSLRAVHTRRRSFDGRGMGGRRGGHLPDHDEWMKVCFENSRDLLDVPKLQQIWSRFRQLPPCGQNVMSHKDLTPANLLVRNERIVGVLDTGDFGPADPTLDLVAAWHMLDTDQRQTVRNCLGCGDIEWKRGAAWAFEQAMGLVWYYQHSNPSMSEMGQITLNRILADHEIVRWTTVVSSECHDSLP